MLRSFRSRLALTVILSALVTGGIGLAIPAYARMRAEEVLRARLGPDGRATIGAVHVGLLVTTLEDVALGTSAMDVQLVQVSLRAPIFGLATDGAHAITAVTVDGGHAAIDLTEVVRARADAASGESAGERNSRTLAVHGLSLVLRSGTDELLAARSIAASWDGTTLTTQVDEIALGDDTIDHAELEAVRTDEVRVSRVALGHVVVSADAVTGEGPIARIRSALRGEGAGEGAGAGEGVGDDEGAGEGLLARIEAIEHRLDPSFSASIEDVTVRRTIDGTPHDVVAGLRASLRRTSSLGYATEGEGHPEGGGSLSWRLDLAPHAPSASGTVTFDRVTLAAFVPFLPSSIPFSAPEHARVSGHLALTTESIDTIHAEGTLAVEELALEHRRIADAPVRGIAFSLHGAADLTPSAHRISVSSLALTMGAARATLGGTIEWSDDHYLLDGRIALPRTSCEDAVHAIPRDLLGDTASFHLSGELGASITAHIDSRDLPHTTLQIQVANACDFTSWPAMADVARFAGPFDHHVEEPDGTTFEMTTGPTTEAWTPISEISPFLVHAVLAHEDASFFEHAGFAPWAIREALIRDLTAGRYVAGGSTITMQLVKNVFLHREKTLARKIQEVLLTWWLETRMEKERILELYLNVIEYGPGVYGIRHAAEHYFGRSPADLSPAESAYLALILPNPPAFHEQYETGEIPRAFRNRVASFVRICGARGRYDAAAVAYGVAEAETLSFHREGDPPPPPRTTEGAVAAIPEIQFFSTVPLARLAVDDTETDDGITDEAMDDDDSAASDVWEEWSP